MEEAVPKKKKRKEKLQVEHGFFASAKEEPRNRGEEVSQFVAYGAASKAEAIIDYYPDVFTQKSTVKEYSLREIANATPLQVAFRTGDVAMCDMMKRHIIRDCDQGKELIRVQLNDVFPKGFNAHLRAQKTNIFDFKAILAAVENATPIDLMKILRQRNHNCPLGQALADFRKAFTAHATNEMVFNPQHFRQILKLYNEYVERSKRHDSDNAEVLWNYVIGYVERYFPTHLIHALAQGPESLYKEHRSLHREFLDDFFKVELPYKAKQGLGFGSFLAPPVYEVESGNSWLCGYDVGKGVGVIALIEFTKLIDYNNSQFEQFMADCSDYHCSPGCLIL